MVDKVMYKALPIGSAKIGSRVGIAEVWFKNGTILKNVGVNRSSDKKVSLTFPVFFDGKRVSYEVLVIPSEIKEDILKKITALIKK